MFPTGSWARRSADLLWLVVGVTVSLLILSTVSSGAYVDSASPGERFEESQSEGDASIPEPLLDYLARTPDVCASLLDGLQAGAVQDGTGLAEQIPIGAVGPSGIDFVKCDSNNADGELALVLWSEDLGPLVALANSSTLLDQVAERDLPGGSFVEYEPGIYLPATRLATVDLSAGHMPIIDVVEGVLR